MALQREAHTLHKSPRQRDPESRQDAGRVFLVVYFLHKPGETERRLARRLGEADQVTRGRSQ